MLETFLNPRSIAVIGASQDVSKIRGRMLRILIESGYDGVLLPVNPSHATVQGLPAYPSISALPQRADMALIATPAEAVCDVLRECAGAGIMNAVVFTAGAAHGTEAERQLVSRMSAVALETGMRVLGPNCEGFFNVRDNVAGNFSPSIHLAAPLHIQGGLQRPISIVSQSGAVGFGLFTQLKQQGLICRHLVTTGNEADLECLDFVEHIVREGGSGPILLFVEGLKDGQRFARVAKLAADHEVPLVFCKVGNSIAGARAAASHTAHLTGAMTAYEATFRRYGVVSALDSDQALTATRVLACLSPARGNRVAVLSTSGGTGVWLADACSAMGLEFPVPDEALHARLAKVIPAIGGIANPVDMSASVIEGQGEVLAEALRVMTEANYMDAVVIAMSLAAKDRIKQMQPALEPFLASTSLPVIIHSQAYATQDNLDALSRMGGLALGMRDTAFALKTLSDYGAFRRTWSSQKACIESVASAPLVSEQACREMLDQGKQAQLLRAYGIALPPEAVVASKKEALLAAHGMGYPVALKIVSAQVQHKTEVGGLALDVRSDEDLESAYEQVLTNVARAAPQARIEGMQIQKMMPPGLEMVLGITRDPDFGHLLMVGLGGVFVELLRDVAFSPVPVSPDQAEDLIRSLKGFSLLEGWRGGEPGDVRALALLASGLARLAAEHPDAIEEIDLNPVLVYASSVCAVDYLVIPHRNALAVRPEPVEGLKQIQPERTPDLIDCSSKKEH
ncbi:acetate--CoA ligase family protein [Ottowia thiooxydans]|uniref:acetate--CoA ligase family protein n=1 Tax=Ottowia thiooxydans TaxID=219182 RepID=UPI00048B4BD1|nr:acetate--CoA ligase family protein [Ottowia thiooxydans]